MEEPGALPAGLPGHGRLPAGRVVDASITRPFPSLEPELPLWPPGVGWPDDFLFGDPHTNSYEGAVLYDDVRLEAPAREQETGP
jgi:hypothetical protein